MSDVPEPLPPLGENPFVGPRPIPGGRRIYGRDRELRELYYQLNSERVVVLHSPSGAGKSSLVGAGLVPLLRERGFDVWPVIRVNSELPPELAGHADVNRFVISTILSLEEALPKSQRRPLKELPRLSLREYVGGRPRQPGAPPNVVLILDQFEEVLTIDPLGEKALDAKHAFFAAVGDSLREPSIWGLFSMREEYLAPLDPYAHLVPTVLRNRFRLDLLSRAAAEEAMIQPSLQAGRAFPAEAARALAERLAMVKVQQPNNKFAWQLGPHVEPVQLQVICRRVWNDMPEDDRSIDPKDLDQYAEVSETLGGYYDESVEHVAKSSTARGRAIREWFDQHIITPSGIRGQVLRGEGTSDGLDNQYVEQLQDTHLIRAEKRAGATWYELAHDRLLAPVRDRNAKWFEAHLSPLERRAALWVKNERHDRLLLSGDDLKEAEEWARSGERELRSEEQALLELSRARRRRGRGLRVAAALAFAFVVAVALYVGKQRGEARVQRDRADAQARYALSQLLVIDSTARPDGETALPMLLALEAERLDRNEQTGNAKIAALLRGNHLLRGLHGHRAEVVAVAWSPDGRWLAAADIAGHVRRWDGRTGADGGEIMPGATRIDSLVWSPTGTLLATGGDGPHGGAVRIWDAGAGASLHELAFPATRIPAIAWSRDSALVAAAGAGGADDEKSGTESGFLTVWDAHAGSVRHEFIGHTAGVYALAFSADGARLASGSADRTVKLWDTTSGSLVADFATPAVVTSVAWSNDGATLASSWGHGVRLWDSMSGSPIEILEAHDKPVETVAWNPTRAVLASVATTGAVKLWDGKTGAPLGEPLGAATGLQQRFAWSPDGNQLVIGGPDGQVAIWSSLEAEQPSARFTGHSQPVVGIAWSPDGRAIASADQAGAINLWTTQGGLFERAARGHTNAVQAVAWSPNGDRVASAAAGSEQSIRIWNVTTATSLLEVPGTNGKTTAIVWSPDGRRLAIAGTHLRPGDDQMYGIVRLVDAATGKPTAKPVEHPTSIVDLAWDAPGDRLLAVGKDGVTLLWDPETGAVTRGDGPTTRVRWCGDHVAFVDPSGAVSLAPANAPLAPRVAIAGSERTKETRIACNRAGTILAASNADGSIDLIDPASPASTWPLRTLTGHEPGAIRDLALSPTGNLLASAAHDGEVRRVRIWDVESSRALFDLSHETGVNACAWSPDGQHLATAAANGDVRLWTIGPERFLLQRAQEIANRNLARAEWKAHFERRGLGDYRKTFDDLPAGD